MKRILTKTIYLEMRQPCMPQVPHPPLDVRIERMGRPSVDQYRFLYRGVGADYFWFDRVLMPSDELRRLLDDDWIELHVLRVNDAPGGFCELDRRVSGEVKIMYFGLFPEHIGQGLGKFFLRRVLDIAWSYQPQRVWLHTCDLDHPAALPNYLKAGFSIYDEKVLEKWIPE